jgi:hypothetical protein
LARFADLFGLDLCRRIFEPQRPDDGVLNPGEAAEIRPKLLIYS